MKDLKGDEFEPCKGEHFDGDQLWLRARDQRKGYFTKRGLFDFVPLDSARHEQRLRGMATKLSHE